MRKMPTHKNNLMPQNKAIYIDDQFDRASGYTTLLVLFQYEGMFAYSILEQLT